jgi:hypothetical protein
MFLAQSKQGIQKEVLCSSLNEAGTKLTQPAFVKARVSQLQPQKILPINATAHSLSSLPVGQLLHELEHRNQSQSPRGLNGSAIVRKERGE